MGDDVTILASGLSFPEGPVVLPDGDVLVVEVRGVASPGCTRRHPDRRWPSSGGGPNGAAIGPDGAVYVVNNGGFPWSEIARADPPDRRDRRNRPPDFTGGWVDRIDLDTGEVTRLLYRHRRRALPRTQRHRVRRARRLLVHRLRQDRARAAGPRRVYYARPTAAACAASPRASSGPTASASRPTATTVYVAETYTGRLLAWDVTAPGEVAEPAPHRRRPPRTTSTRWRSRPTAPSWWRPSSTACAPCGPTAASSTRRCPTP